MEIKKMTVEHLDAYNDLLRYAFQVTETNLLEIGWEDEEICQSKYPVLERAHVLGCFDGDRLASQFAVYPVQMNVHGDILDIGFVTSVATYPEYAGLGLMTDLMKQSLSHMREIGQSLSLLYPYSIPLYRHRGWEIVSDKLSFKVKDYQLPKDIQVPGNVRRVDDNDKDLLALHTKFAKRTHGCIIRNELAWEEYWRWDAEEMGAAVYYGKDGTPLGYMVYFLREEIMYIKEMIYLCTEAWNGLWKFISAHESMVTEVRGSNYHNEPIAFWLRDSDIQEAIRPYIMGRIIDLSQFLRQFQFYDEQYAPWGDSERAAGESQYCLTIHVTDSFLDWNNLSFTIKRNPKTKPDILLHAYGSNTITMDIGTLTTMLLGYKRPATLAQMERFAATAQQIDFLEQIIPAEKPYISDYI